LPASTLAVADAQARGFQAARPVAGHYVAGTLFLLAAALSTVGLLMALEADPANRAGPAASHVGASAEGLSDLIGRGKGP
jgi:hypothetical protein